MPRTSAPPVFLHVGTMKSGTTFIQSVLIGHKEELASAGHLFPGERWKDQVAAAQDVARAIRDDPVLTAESAGAWRSLAGQMLEHRGQASVVSMEFLAHASPRQARTAVVSLRPAEVHVVLTVRDATRTIPSHWQTSVKSNGTTDWHDFRTAVAKAGGLQARLGRWGDSTAAEFRRIHDVARVLQAWARSVPPERLHVVTVPASGADPTLLWRRFAGVVGLDPDLGSDASPANESLGYASTELLRRVNLTLTDVPVHDRHAIVRAHLANEVLARRSAEESRPLLDRATLDFGLAWNARTREAVHATGAELVGDLDDLPTEPTSRHDGAVDDAQPPPGDDELLAAAETAVDGLRGLVDRQRRRAAKRGLDDVPPPHHRDTGSDPRDAVAAAVAEIADLARTSIELRRRIRADAGPRQG